MDRNEVIFGPNLEVDEKLFEIAPVHTLKQFTARMNRRLVRLELIICAGFAIEMGTKLV